MAKADNQKQFTLRLDPELFERIQKLATVENRSVSNEMNVLLELGVKAHEAEGAAPEMASDPFLVLDKAKELAGQKGPEVSESGGRYTTSLSGEPVPAEDLELEYLRDALWAVEEAARKEGVELALDDKARWIVLVYRTQRMMPTFEPAELANRVRKEIQRWAKKQKGDDQGKGGASVSPLSE